SEEDQMFHFERGMDPDLEVQVRSSKCTTLHEMVEQEVRIEDSIIATKGPIRGGLEMSLFRVSPSLGDTTRGRESPSFLSPSIQEDFSPIRSYTGGATSAIPKGGRVMESCSPAISVA
ncbi:hypothetical protein Drorol1_Dr00025587, partial [Drosera rotundifolia]